eukprot:scaffold1581_cov342-Prasinococcus_capsulatus_cf.AAC.19
MVVGQLQQQHRRTSEPRTVESGRGAARGSPASSSSPRRALERARTERSWTSRAKQGMTAPVAVMVRTWPRCCSAAAAAAAPGRGQPRRRLVLLPVHHHGHPRDDNSNNNHPHHHHHNNSGSGGRDDDVPTGAQPRRPSRMRRSAAGSKHASAPGRHVHGLAIGDRRSPVAACIHEDMSGRGPLRRRARAAAAALSGSVHVGVAWLRRWGGEDGSGAGELSYRGRGEP